MPQRVREKLVQQPAIYMEKYFAVAIAFAATFCSLVILIRYALKWGMLAQPGGHSIHIAPTPVVGGLAMFIGVVAGFLVLPKWPPAAHYYLAGAALLTLTGVLDDRDLIPMGCKALCQISAACLLVFGGDVVIQSMGNLLGLGDVQLGWFAPLFSVFAIVGLINAINMLDGIDGLAGCVALAIVLVLAIQVYLHVGFALGPLLVLTGVIIGFLYFNLRWRDHGARTFMGDTGSMLLGYSIAWVVIALSQEPVATVLPMAVLWIVIVPVMDTFRLMALRIVRGRSPFAPSTRHLHHILIRHGWQVNAVVAIAFLATLFFSAVALVLSVTPFAEPVLFYGFAGLFFLYVAATARFARKTRGPKHLATHPLADEGHVPK